MMEMKSSFECTFPICFRINRTGVFYQTGIVAPAGAVAAGTLWSRASIYCCQYPIPGVSKNRRADPECLRVRQETKMA